MATERSNSFSRSSRLLRLSASAFSLLSLTAVEYRPTIAVTLELTTGMNRVHSGTASRASAPCSSRKCKQSILKSFTRPKLITCPYSASFSFGGTELVGLAAAEAANPARTIPLATKQVFWRITIFYVLSLFLVGLIVPSDNDNLLNSSGADTKYSPFVISMNLAGIKVLPSIFNVVITMAVLSVANSCAYGSTRTMQALAQTGMGPKFLAYVDNKGRPLWCIAIQIAFGFLAFINEAAVGAEFFNWLLALSGLANFFIWGSICLSHIRFRAGWQAQGHTLAEIPYTATFGIAGSIVGLGLNILCLIASFYAALFPVGGSPDAYAFFQQYLAAPLILTLYLGWKLWTRDWKLFIRAKDMDVVSGLRQNLDEIREMAEEKQAQTGAKNIPMKIFRALF